MAQSKVKHSAPDSPFSRSSEELQSFRHQLKRSRDLHRGDWEWTRRLVRPPQLTETLSELERCVRRSSYSPGLQKILVRFLRQVGGQGDSGGLPVTSQGLTGYPPTKAVRALCLLFGVGREHPVRSEEAESSGLRNLEDLLTQSTNPYDVLRHVPAPSLLDIGAGDLTFEEELVRASEPWLVESRKQLRLHALDRLKPGSELGGRYHVDRERYTFLNNRSPDIVQFQFWGGVNLMDVSTLHGLLSQYTVVTCHAPATPTFAYEPTRLSQAAITAALTHTKGAFRKVRCGQEMALEVVQDGRTYTFPDWKFEIIGPLALLNVMAARGQLCVLSAIDSEVFWELLAQLLEDERYRPPDVIFEPSILPEVFGTLYEELMRMPIGGSRQLAHFADLRQALPSVVSHPTVPPSFRFRSVEIRRGAVFEGIPSSFTARQFPYMREEQAPWWVICVPDPT